MGLSIFTYIVSDFQQNARIVVDNDTQKAMIIDPGADVELLFNASQHFSVDFIVLTHCHIDHAGGVKALLELFKKNKKTIPKLAYHNKDTVLAQSIEMVATMYGLSGNYKNVPKCDIDLENHDTFILGNSEFKCLFTPGHAPGHICLYYDKPTFKLHNEFSQTLNCNQLLIGGDTLFFGGQGRTDLPYCNHNDLIKSIRNTLLSLPNSTLVCSGHGQNTTIGNERNFHS
jgi:hydroxyacylglutathione hydrolase